MIFRKIHGWVLVLMLLAQPALGLDIRASMLAQGSAVLEIDGKSRFLKAGARSPEGVLLVSASQQGAVIEWEGTQRTLTLNKLISTQFNPAQKAEVRIATSRGGHYVTPGRINGVPVTFMIDTGATTVAMNYLEAEKLGIDYRAGQAITVNTANGLAKAYRVTLNRVSVGDIELHQVPAAVSTTTSPTVILLGNSYLGKVDMRVEEGVLLLQAKQ